MSAVVQVLVEPVVAVRVPRSCLYSLEVLLVEVLVEVVVEVVVCLTASTSKLPLLCLLVGGALSAF